MIVPDRTRLIAGSLFLDFRSSLVAAFDRGSSRPFQNGRKSTSYTRIRNSAEVLRAIARLTTSDGGKSSVVAAGRHLPQNVSKNHP